MKEITSPALLSKYLQQYNITEMFDIPDLPFGLYEYENGELVNYIRPLPSYLKFLVDGEIRIYTLNEDGGTRLVYQGRPVAMIGDMELCGSDGLSYCYEAIGTVRCVELPLTPLRTALLNDNRFLRNLAKSLTRKLNLFTGREISLDTTVEKRLLYYFQNEAENQRFAGVETLAFRLHCSRSQIQRGLRNLLQQGIIKKIRKGEYALAQGASESVHENSQTPCQT